MEVRQDPSWLCFVGNRGVVGNKGAFGNRNVVDNKGS